MIVVSISGVLEGIALIDRELQAIEERATDVSAAHPAVAKVFRAVVRKTFESEGQSSAAGPWPALAKRTVRERERLGYGGSHPILRRTNEMMRSVVERSADSIYVSTPNYLGLGSANPYLMYHQSTAPRSRLPRRPVFEPTEDDKHELVRPFRLWLTGHAPDAAEPPTGQGRPV